MRRRSIFEAGTLSSRTDRSICCGHDPNAAGVTCRRCSNRHSIMPSVGNTRRGPVPAGARSPVRPAAVAPSRGPPLRRVTRPPATQVAALAEGPGWATCHCLATEYCTGALPVTIADLRASLVHRLAFAAWADVRQHHLDPRVSRRRKRRSAAHRISSGTRGRSGVVPYIAVIAGYRSQPAPAAAAKWRRVRCAGRWSSWPSSGTTPEPRAEAALAAFGVSSRVTPREIRIRIEDDSPGPLTPAGG